MIARIELERSNFSALHAAMHDDMDAELIRILRDLADKIEKHGTEKALSCGVIYDLNGNKVGYTGYCPGDYCEEEEEDDAGN